MSGLADVALKRKIYFERHLAACIDVSLAAQLIIIYLHDVSTLRLIMGFLLQLLFLSPRPPGFPFTTGLNKRQLILLIFGYNLWCVLMHSIFSPSQPIDGKKFLHGGMTIEFIGEIKLDSCIPLLGWDLMVMLFQWTLFSLNFPATTANTSGGHTLQDNNTNSYSGNVIVRDICISQSFVENWRNGGSNNENDDSDEDSDVNDSYERNEANRMV